MKRFIPIAIGILLLTLQSKGQEDWETYVLYIKDRPVSVMVDLGFANSSLAKQNQNVIIVSLRVGTVQKDGLPLAKDIRKLDTLENELVDQLHSGLGAVYTGRYTSNGKRDFYFYTNDTSSCHSHVEKIVKPYQYRFTVLCKDDPQLSNYTYTLYPTQVELQRIYNRRMIDHLVKAGDQLTAPRVVDHLLFFKTDDDRRKFAKEVIEKRFTVIGAGEEKGVKEQPFSLEISRVDKVDEDSIEEVSLYLWELALKYGARYDGWETFVVKSGEQKE